MNHPLKLRLLVAEHTCGRAKVWQQIEGHVLAAVCKNGMLIPAVLQFENPLNGTWHPVETVVEEKD